MIELDSNKGAAEGMEYTWSNGPLFSAIEENGARRDYFARQFAVDAALRLGADRYSGDVNEMLHSASQIFKFVTGKDTSSAS